MIALHMVSVDVAGQPIGKSDDCQATANQMGKPMQNANSTSTGARSAQYRRARTSRMTAAISRITAIAPG